MTSAAQRRDLATPRDPPAPDRLLAIAAAFRPAKILMAAVDLGVFTALGGGARMQGAHLAETIGVHPRGARDFFDALVALDMLERDADGAYANAPEASCYLDARGEGYVGESMQYLNRHVYGVWGGLEAALRTGAPQAGPMVSGDFGQFYANATAMHAFTAGMNGTSVVPARALARALPWSEWGNVLDIGTAEGCVPLELAREHPSLTAVGLDLPPLETAFLRRARTAGLGDRVRFQAGDFLRDALPRAGVCVLGRILHDWDVATRRRLLVRCREALPDEGILVVWEAMVDDARRELPGLLSSLNMLLQTPAGSESTRSDCAALVRSVGFEVMQFVPLTPAYTALVARRRA